MIRRSKASRRTLLGVLLLCGVGSHAAAQDAAAPDAGAAEAGAPETGSAAAPSGAAVQDAAVTPQREKSATCVEHLPAGKERPTLSESLPNNGVSGHALAFTIVVKHGRGETLLPGGFRLQGGGDEARALARSEFMIPHPDGGAGPKLSTKEVGDGSETTVELFVVPLPKKPGRNTLTLPPLPIAVQRASGEVLTICTRPHDVIVEDPIANTPDAKPKFNPEPRRQQEVWTTAKNVALGALVAAVVAILVALLMSRFLKREKPKPPPPPPRPPWEVALEALADLEHQDLVARERLVEHYERVSDILREYCGDRYGFDGLESTTREMLGILRRVIPPIPALDEIEKFMRRADLVKFARLTPDAEECGNALAEARSIIERTVPPPLPSAQRQPASAGGKS